MWEINQRNADRRGVNILQQTEDFNALFDWRANIKRPWILELTLEGSKPASWFGGLKSWQKNKRYWFRYLKAARRFVKGKRRVLCPRADDYGAATDKPKNSCSQRIQCLKGGTFQRYWDNSRCRRRG
jgi:hypothetical protein